MLEDWFTRAHADGSRVGDLAMYVVRADEGGPVECRTAIFSEQTVEARFVPPSRVVTNVFHPVQRLATHLESRCRLVSHPTTRTVTTYSMQYDAFSKSTRSVPQMHTETSQTMTNECHMEPVTSMVTQWERTPEAHFTPPSTTYLTRRRVREGEPVCYAAPAGAVTRVEGKVFARAP